MPDPDETPAVYAHAGTAAAAAGDTPPPDDVPAPTANDGEG